MFNKKNMNILEKYHDPKNKGWGFTGWVFLHSIADSFPENPTPDDRKYVELFFTQCLPRLLPCSYCNAHLAEQVVKNTIDTSSGNNLSNWLYSLHNDVRSRMGHPTLSMQDCQKEQELFRSINWTEVVKDLKNACNIHQGDTLPPGCTNKLNNVGASGDTTHDTNFRRVVLGDTISSKTITFNQKAVVMVLCLSTIILLVLSLYLFFRNRNLEYELISKKQNNDNNINLIVNDQASPSL